jgi:hypothetical protein
MYFKRKFKFFKTHKKSYKGLLCISNPQYGCHNQEIRCFSQFMLQTGDFSVNRTLTPVDFE